KDLTPEEDRAVLAAIEAAAAEFRPFTGVWDVPSGKMLRRIPTTGSALRTLAFSPDGKRVAVADGQRVTVIDPGSEGPADAREYHTGAGFGVTFDGSSRVWSGGADRMVRGLRWSAPADPIDLRGSSNTVLRLAVSPDGWEVAIAAADLGGQHGTVYRFDLARVTNDLWRAPSGDW